MDVHVAPEIAKKLTDLAATTGRGTDELVQDALVGYLEELTLLQDALDTRYDDLKSGRVQTIDGDEAFARLREKSEHRRSRPA
jgi:predicted transcriptional regulator